MLSVGISPKDAIAVLRRESSAASKAVRFLASAHGRASVRRLTLLYRLPRPACWRAGVSVDSKGDTHTVDPQRRHMSRFRFGSEVEANLARRSLLLLGQKATLQGDRHMSALPQKSDIIDFMMGWTPRRRHRCAKVEVLSTTLREASVSEVSIIGLDIAKHVFHAPGADERGRAILSKRISRGKLLDFFAAQPSCTVALEACGGAHHWARQLTQLGHDVRLIPPVYVKAFVKRQKNDAIDAEAICEAAQRPSMRFVAVKSEEQQAAGLSRGVHR